MSILHCAEAFSSTSLDSLTIPDSVVEVGERCFVECKRLLSVRFGALSRVELADAFRETSIKSSSLPDGVVVVTCVISGQ